MSGMKVTKNNTNTNGIIQGITIVVILWEGILVTEDKIYISPPTGGVINPIIRFRTTIIPRCIGWIPISILRGYRIGMTSIIAEVTSINIPRKNKIAFIINNII